MLAMILTLALWAQFQPNPGGPPGGFPPRAAPGGAIGRPPGPSAGEVGVVLAVYAVIFALFYIPTTIGMWMTFNKMGQPGWAAIFCFLPPVPCYFMGEVSGKGGGYGLMVGIGMMLPCIGLIALVFYIMLLIEFCNACGSGAGMAIGLFFLAPVFWLILGLTLEGPRRSRRPRSRGDVPRSRRRPDDDDEDDRPRRRPVTREDDDDDDEPPRRRPAAREERIRRTPEDEAPRKRRRPADDDDDDDDAPPPPRKRRRDDDDD